MIDVPEFGLFAVDAPTRTVRGILVPYGEPSAVSSTGNAPLTFREGDLAIPRDHSVVQLNKLHDRFDPIGRGKKLDPTHERGLYSEFQIADTDEGDAWLADHGDLVRLSPELRDIVRHPDGTATATVTGAALVDAGAWASAGLFAIGDITDLPSAPVVLEVPDDAPLAILTDRLPQSIAVATPDGEASATYTPEDAPSEEPTEQGEFAAMTTTIVPDGATIPAPTIDTSASGLFRALAQVGTSGDTSALAAFIEADANRTGLFAAYAPLNDITATAMAVAMAPQLVGEIWKKKAFIQRILPLFDHDALTALKVSGWTWGTLPQVGDWAGDKAAIPSNTPTLLPVETTAERIAGGHDIDRALRDFGNEQFWSGYFRAMTEDYARKADRKVYAKIAAGATTVAPGTVPAGSDAGLVAIIDGALAVIDAGYAPTFSLVSPAIFRSILLTPKDKVLEFLTAGMGLEEGDLAGFRIIPEAALAAKRTITGTKSAATVYELPGAPVRVEGLDVAHGGIDPALFGYVATIINDAKALASVTTA